MGAEEIGKDEHGVKYVIEPVGAIAPEKIFVLSGDDRPIGEEKAREKREKEHSRTPRYERVAVAPPNEKNCITHGQYVPKSEHTPS